MRGLHLLRGSVLVTCLAVGDRGVHAAIVAGPIVNPANGHQYYLLSPTTWTASEAEAITLGGHLVTINNAAENQFIVDTFILNGHVSDPLWIGFSDQMTEGAFVWASGQAVGYTNWQPFEPNDYEGEDYSAINWHFGMGESTDHGVWNDTPDGGRGPYAPFHGVVEVVPASCVADIMPPGGDGQVTIADITNVLSAYGLRCRNCPQDIRPQPDGDNQVTIADINAVLAAYGDCMP